MDAATKRAIGKRIRSKRESAGYTREQLSELCALSPRFLANVELGDSAVSLETLMTLCRVLSCSSDSLLFGDTVDCDSWDETVSRIRQLDLIYKDSVDKALQGIIEVIAKAEKP